MSTPSDAIIYHKCPKCGKRHHNYRDVKVCDECRSSLAQGIDPLVQTLLDRDVPMNKIILPGNVQGVVMGEDFDAPLDEFAD